MQNKINYYFKWLIILKQKSIKKLWEKLTEILSLKMLRKTFPSKSNLHIHESMYYTVYTSYNAFLYNLFVWHSYSISFYEKRIFFFSMECYCSLCFMEERQMTWGRDNDNRTGWTILLIWNFIWLELQYGHNLTSTKPHTNPCSNATLHSQILMCKCEKWCHYSLITFDTNEKAMKKAQRK